MPKNPTKYRYYQVGLIRDSYAEHRLKEDAERHHMANQLAKLIALRLTEYYTLVDRGIIVPGAAAGAGAVPFPIALTPGGSGTAQTTQTTLTTQTNETEEADEEDTLAFSADLATSNADAAADYWAMDD